MLTVEALAGSPLVVVEWKAGMVVMDKPDPAKLFAREVHGLTAGFMIDHNDKELTIAWSWNKVGELDGITVIDTNTAIQIDELQPPLLRLTLGTLELHQ